MESTGPEGRSVVVEAVSLSSSSLSILDILDKCTLVVEGFGRRHTLFGLEDVRDGTLGAELGTRIRHVDKRGMDGCGWWKRWNLWSATP